MEITIWEKIANTHWWYFAWFFALMWVAYGATKPRLVPIRMAFLFSVCFFLLGFLSITLSQSIVAHHLLYLFLGMGIGVSLGWLQYRMLGIAVVLEKSALLIPGTWFLMIIIGVVFTAKLYFDFEIMIAPTTLKNPNFAPYINFFFGLLSGIFFGRVWYGKYCLKNGPYVTDKPKH